MDPGGLEADDSAHVGAEAAAQAAVPGCLEAADWERVRAAAGDTLEPAVFAHLRACRSCSERFAALAAEWSHAEIALELLADPDPGTRAIIDRLAERVPSRVPSRPPPSIDGLENLVEIGRGGMGVVYRAHDPRLGRTVAVKVLSASVALSAEGAARAEREAGILARVVHPNIVRIFSVVEAGDAPAIVMEWIDGPSLAEHGRPEPIAPRDAATLVRDLASAVAAVHAAGVTHRDIKPANVLLAPATGGGPGVPKLVDFGLARPDDEQGVTITRPSVAVGTPSFMAPEQTGLDPTLGPVGPATDIHGLGAILYWLLSGKAPYEGATTAAVLRRAANGDATPIGSLVPRLPRDIGTIVATCLERSPHRRYHSAETLADELGRFLDGRPILARRHSLLERGLKWTRRRPVAAAFVACVAVAGTLFVAGVTYHVWRLELAHAAMTAKREEAIAAASLARESFARLTDSSAERFLARGGVLDAADRDHLRQIRQRYRDWPLEPDPSASLHFRAEGLFRLANLFNSLQWSDDAIETVRDYLRCHDELDRIGVITGTDIARKYLLLRLERGILAMSGRFDDAIAATHAAIAGLEVTVDADPASGRHLAMMWGDLGNLKGKLGRLAEARGDQEKAMKMFDDLITAAPDDADLARLSLSVLYNAAINPAFADDRGARREILTKLVDRSQAGLERFPTEPTDFGRGLLLGLSSLAHADLEDGRAEAALDKVVLRGATARRLAKGGQGRQYFLEEMVGAAGQSFRCLQALGRPEDARADVDEAVTLATKAVADQPAVRQRTWVLVEILLAKASLEEATGRPAEAIAVYRMLLDAIAPWTKGDEKSHIFQVNAADIRAAIERLAAEERSSELSR